MSTPVRHRLTAVSAAICAIVLAFTIASCGSNPEAPTTPAAVSTGTTDAKGGSDQCGPGGIKDERAPFTATAPDGQVVGSVCVKAGTQAIPLSGSNNCYLVTFDGATATVSRNPAGGNDCKDISYVVFYTAAPTPTPTPTVVVTPTPTNTPTGTPTGTPTNTPTDTPTPTPTNTPTNTPVLPTGTPTNTPTNTPVLPTPTPTNTPTATAVGGAS